MIKTKSVSLAEIPKILSSYDFDMNEIKTILSMLVHLWKCNQQELHYDLTKEFIEVELDLDSLSAQTLVLDSMSSLMTIATQVHQALNDSTVTGWSIHDYVILLEYLE